MRENEGFCVICLQSSVVRCFALLRIPTPSEIKHTSPNNVDPHTSGSSQLNRSPQQPRRVIHVQGDSRSSRPGAVSKQGLVEATFFHGTCSNCQDHRAELSQARQELAVCALPLLRPPIPCGPPCQGGLGGALVDAADVCA